jgi:cystathionine beta-lyase
MNNFDEIIPRHNTESYKWDFFKDPKTVIPMPVADMDFRCAEPILAAMHDVTAHGVFGYSIIPDELNDIFVKRLKKKYNWVIQKEWLVWIPGLIPGLTSICNMIGKPGDEVITTVPSYYPIHLAPARAGKNLVTVPLVVNDARWTIDFNALQKAITGKTKLFILCNPHNPGGTVFNKEELQRLLDICSANKIIICADEIHCDLILDPAKQHIPLASLCPAAAARTITLMAPSKTFNLAGLGCSVAIISNDELRKKFQEIKEGLFPFLSRYSIKAAIAAYTAGESWHSGLIRYLKSNHDLLYEKINEIPGLEMNEHHATYLAWIKCNIPNFVDKLLLNGVRVNDGNIYLKDGFFRLNFACPKAILQEAVNRLQRTSAMHSISISAL